MTLDDQITDTLCQKGSFVAVNGVKHPDYLDKTTFIIIIQGSYRHTICLSGRGMNKIYFPPVVVYYNAHMTDLAHGTVRTCK